jgi:hypothetical protein
MKKLLYNIIKKIKEKELYVNMTTEKEYITKALMDNSLAVIYPRDGSEKSAEKLVNMVDAAIGIAEFKNDEDNTTRWGVLIDKTKLKKLNLSEDE